MTATYLDSGPRALPRPRAVVLAADSIFTTGCPRYSVPTASGGLRRTRAGAGRPPYGGPGIRYPPQRSRRVATAGRGKGLSCPPSLSRTCCWSAGDVQDRVGALGFRPQCLDRICRRQEQQINVSVSGLL